MLTDAGQLDLIRSGRVTWEDVIEESLRSQAPVPNLPLRFAVEDIDIGGVTLRAGEAILACYGAAGRDPLVYGRGAGQFDVTRAAKEHLAFGYGVHHASARHWPGWKPRSRSRRSSSVIRICPWPSTPAS